VAVLHGVIAGEDTPNEQRRAAVAVDGPAFAAVANDLVGFEGAVDHDGAAVAVSIDCAAEAAVHAIL